MQPEPQPSVVGLEERVRLLTETLARVAESAWGSVHATPPEVPVARIANLARAQAYDRAAQIAAEILGAAPRLPAGARPEPAPAVPQ